MRNYDVAVIGAGPAGAASALRLARTGADVLLLDRAKFPRDKPCGGAVTGRALLRAPCDIAPVVENVVRVADLAGADGIACVRESRAPIAYMTQRRRLDLHIAERAAAAGAEFRDGVGRVSIDPETLTITAGGERCRASVVVGADGANGMTAERIGLGETRAIGVALEGNLPRSSAAVAHYDGRALVHFNVLRGGYGWIFPKEDHVNVGVGGWLSEGPQLRACLEAFCEEHGVPFDQLTDVRGHRLPMKTSRARIADRRVCLVGDAAALVDPLTGDGMYECFLSAELAATHVGALLHGTAADLSGYQRELELRLRAQHWASWLLKSAFDRLPRTTYRIAMSPPVWAVIRDLLTGDLAEFESAAGRRLPLRLIGALAARTERRAWGRLKAPLSAEPPARAFARS
ncbi:MAG: geranylgeranyl reductase family protein [Acidobacteria bacterium]|nr:geranylgeranyl reductase family protein [Acidobacteriota bacterium]